MHSPSKEKSLQIKSHQLIYSNVKYIPIHDKTKKSQIVINICTLNYCLTAGYFEMLINYQIFMALVNAPTISKVNIGELLQNVRFECPLRMTCLLMCLFQGRI